MPKKEALSIAAMKDCVGYVQLMERDQEMLDRIREQRDRVVITVTVKIPSDASSGLPRHHKDAERTHTFVTRKGASDEERATMAALLHFMEQHYSRGVDNLKSTIREFGVDPDKVED